MADLDIEKKIDMELDKLFHPVNPDSSYISNLQKKLISKADVSIEYPNYLLIIIIIGSGLALGLALVFILNHIIRILSGKGRNGQ
jgi:hypothetical protein